MRRAAKVDATQAAIVDALHAAGAFVQSLATVGRGTPDLLVAFRGTWHTLECKSKGGRLTDDQLVWIDAAHAAGAVVDVVFTPEQALRAIGAMR